MRRHVLVVLVLAAAAPSSAQSQGVTVRGVVVDAASGAPLPRALVVAAAAAVGRSALTDDAGAFALDVPGDVQLRITKAGFATTLVPAQRGMAMEVGLPRGASIAGRVTTPNGTPVPGVMVNAQPDPAPASSSAPTRFGVSTDQRGEYRFAGLTAGRYTLSVVERPHASDRHPDAIVSFAARLRDGLLDEPLASLSPPRSVDVRAGDHSDGNDLAVAQRPPCNWALNRARPTDTGTGVIEGRVMGPSGPLACVLVRMVQRGAPVYRTEATDEDGRFAFTRMPAGVYSPQASGDGYTLRELGQAGNEPGRLIALRDGEKVDGLVITLPAITAVGGTIRDEFGEPVEGVQVAVYELRQIDGRLVAVDPGTTRGTTDDRGRYRIFGLAPGAYVVDATRNASVPAADGQHAGPTTVYYPGAADASLAHPVQVDAARDVDGLDFSLAAPPGARLSGTVVSSSGRAFAGMVRIVPSQRSGGVIVPPRLSAASCDGTFTFGNVPPGDYVVQAAGNAPGNGFGLQHVRVDGADPITVAVTAAPRSTLEGYLVREGDETAPAASFAVVPLPADADFVGGAVPRPAPIPADGTVRIAGLSGPMRFALATAPEGWYLKSAVVEGANAAVAPFDFGLAGRVYAGVDVVVSNQTTTVAGSAVDGRGRRLPDYSVALFSVDRVDWFAESPRLRLMRAEADRTFRFNGVPPGEYWIAPLVRFESPVASGQWQEAEALTTLAASAERVRLVEGQSLMVTLRVP